jgi:hypothetical protein
LRKIITARKWHGYFARNKQRFMERKTLKQLHRNLTWQSRIYAIIVLATVIFAHVFDAWNSDWATTIIAVVALVLLLDSFAVSFHRHPKTWQLLKWGVILIALALLLIGFQ